MNVEMLLARTAAVSLPLVALARSRMVHTSRLQRARCGGVKVKLGSRFNERECVLIRTAADCDLWVKKLLNEETTLGVDSEWRSSSLNFQERGVKKAGPTSVVQIAPEKNSDIGKLKSSGAF